MSIIFVAFKLFLLLEDIIFYFSQIPNHRYENTNNDSLIILSRNIKAMCMTQLVK
jgi:hypothetical protein